MEHMPPNSPRRQPVQGSADDPPSPEEQEALLSLKHHDSDDYGPEEQKALLGLKHELNPTQADELYRLLKDMFPLKFSHSKQLSHFIAENKLGRKYPNISGIVKMEGSDRSGLIEKWNLVGGFPPRIYAILCDELELENQGTDAKPVGFISFKEMQARVQQTQAVAEPSLPDPSA